MAFRLKKSRSKNQPVVVYFHGGGNGGNNNKALNEFRLPYLKLMRKKCTIIVPQAPYNVNFNDYISGIKELIEIIAKEVDADKNRIYVFGGSAGGRCTWQMAYNYPEFVAKPSVDSAGGAGVQFISEKMDAQKLKELKASFTNDFIIQEVLKQHDCLNAIYPHSVNTIRVMTFNWHGEVYVLSTLLRMGVNGKRVDNMVSGGVNCAIRPDGTLCNRLFNAIGTLFEGHPNSGSVEGKKIENFQSIIDAACESHKQLPYMGIISWDFALDKFCEPVLIEFNMKPQGLDLHQRENGPIFGDLTVDILDEVFLQKNK